MLKIPQGLSTLLLSYFVVCFLLKFPCFLLGFLRISSEVMYLQSLAMADFTVQIVSSLFFLAYAFEKASFSTKVILPFMRRYCLCYRHVILP